MLEVSNLECRLSDNLIIDDLSFSLNKGEVLEITGSNGTGKTTILRSLVGLVPDKKGKILWNGVSMNSLCSEQCFYQGHLLAIKLNLTVVENLTLFSPLSFNKLELMDVLTKVQLQDYQSRLVSDLSVGQAKRVAIAKWLLQKKELYLIDEPFTALDNTAIDLVGSLIEKLKADGASFIITGHRSTDLKDKSLSLDKL